MLLILVSQSLGTFLLAFSLMFFHLAHLLSSLCQQIESSYPEMYCILDKNVETSRKVLMHQVFRKDYVQEAEAFKIAIIFFQVCYVLNTGFVSNETNTDVCMYTC